MKSFLEFFVSIYYLFPFWLFLSILFVGNSDYDIDFSKFLYGILLFSFTFLLHLSLKLYEDVEKYKKYQKQMYNDYEKKLDNIRIQKDKEYGQLNEYTNHVKQQYEEIKNNIRENFRYTSEYIADLETVDFDLCERYLKTKKHPAYKRAIEVKELKEKAKEFKNEFKMMRYEYDYLFSLFPELINYIDFYNDEKEKIDDVKEKYDYVKNWVTKEEYEKLSENEKNQKALDNYIASRKKNKWQIGRDYELFIGYEYEKKGYKVEYTGIIKQLDDLGRDIIATKGNEINIIQCKNWSDTKIIHEKHICQLFGTVIQYNIENNAKANAVFITTTKLSDTAQNFAEYLGVKIIQNKKFKEFPRIKCNINNGEKIYHLPFDQQYDRTIIDKKGEFFAWSVQQAYDNGFRRAKRHYITQKTQT